MKVKDIINVIEDFAPLNIQEEWDNSGLIVGSPNDEVSSILLALDCTPDLVDEAISHGVNMIITHHPLIFKGIKKINPEDPVGLSVIKAISAGISIYSAHTSIDKVIKGVSGAMAERLGLENIEILDDEGEGYGLGVVGELPQELYAKELITLVKEKFLLKTLKSSRPIEGKIKKLAMCGGSGSSLISKAKASGAQAYISADMSYHHFVTQDDFMIMDIGHYESEIEIVEVLYSLLKKNFPNFAVRITENIYSNPIFYF